MDHMALAQSTRPEALYLLARPAWFLYHYATLASSSFWCLDFVLEECFLWHRVARQGHVEISSVRTASLTTA